MIVNKQLNEVFKEIAKNSVAFSNTPSVHYPYLRKLLRVYKTHLTEQEQIYLLSLIMENLNYRNVMTDPDTMFLNNNIKIRTYFVIFLMTLGFVFITAFFFGASGLRESIVDTFNSIVKLMGG